MLSRIRSLGSCVVVLTLLLFAGSAAAQDVSPRCEAAMDRAAGHYSKCLLSADASFARHGNLTKLANRQARCETRFDRRTSRAVSRHGADACPSSDLVAAMGRPHRQLRSGRRQRGIWAFRYRAIMGIYSVRPNRVNFIQTRSGKS